MPSFDELRRTAATKGVNLLHVYLACGFADSTYYRHRDGRNGMTIATYGKLKREIAAQAAKVAA